LEASEDLLIRQLKKGDKAVFEKIYNEYYSGLVAFAQGYLFDLDESKELVQKFFVQLWLKTSSIQIQTSLKSYLFSSVKNRCLNHLRDLKIRDRNNLQYIEAYLASHQGPGELDRLSEMEKELLQEIRKLPDQIKKILFLKYFKGKKQREIADELGITENTVKTQLSRGKSKLHKALHKKVMVLALSPWTIDDLLGSIYNFLKH